MWRKMRFLVSGFVVVLLCLGLSSQFASADILDQVLERMAYVDLEKVFQEYEKKQALEQKLQEEGQTKRQQLSERREELEQLREEYEAQELLLSEEAKKQRQEEIAQKSETLKELLDKISQQMEEKERAYTQDILSDIMSKIEEIAKKEGYIFVFDKAALLYGAPTQDITETVITQLNKEYEAGR